MQGGNVDSTKGIWRFFNDITTRMTVLWHPSRHTIAALLYRCSPLWCFGMLLMFLHDTSCRIVVLIFTMCDSARFSNEHTFNHEWSTFWKFINCSLWHKVGMLTRQSFWLGLRCHCNTHDCAVTSFGNVPHTHTHTHTHTPHTHTHTHTHANANSDINFIVSMFPFVRLWQLCVCACLW